MTYKQCLDCGAVRVYGAVCYVCGSPNALKRRHESRVRTFPAVERAKPLFDSRHPRSIFEPLVSPPQSEEAKADV